MNKKFGALIIFLFLTLSITVAIAIENPLEDGIDNLREEFENISDITEDEDARSEYLTQEWTKLLEKTKAGKILLGISNFFSKLSPLFKIILGIEYSLSWAFFLAVLIWLTLFLILNPVVSVLFDNRIIGIIASIIITSLIGISGTIKKAVDTISEIVTNKTILTISIIITILIVIIGYFLGKIFGKYLENLREESEKTKTEESEKKIQALGKVSEKELKS